MNYIILKPINGPTHPIILFHRKFLNNSHVLIQVFEQLFSQITEYSVASTENAAFIIGGYNWDGTVLDIIAKFQDNQWTRYGSLKATRRLHGSIQSGDLTMIIGGDSST